MKHLARQLILVAAVALASVPACAAIELKGAHFNDTYQVGSQSLQLNGAGVRVKLIIDVYAAGIYVGHKDHSAAGLLAQPGPKSLQIVLLRDLTGEDFAEAMVKGFKKNNSDSDVARFQPKLDELRKLMMDFGAVKKGTSIHIDLTASGSTHVTVDGALKGNDMPGEDFYTALLRIWLGNAPVDADLKNALLGGK